MKAILRFTNTPLIVLPLKYMSISYCKIFINNNHTMKIYIEHIIRDNASIIISKFIKNMIKQKNMIKYIVNDFENIVITKKTLAMYYYLYYEKRHINSFYNNNCTWKSQIIKKYKDENNDENNNPSRIDLFNLIKNIPVNDVMSIGW